MATVRRFSLVLVLAFTEAVWGLTIHVDYSRDGPSTFFDTQSKKDALEAAADYVERLLMDDLQAIVPTAENQWAATLVDPSSGASASISNLFVPGDTLIVYAGARDLPGELRAQGGPGGQLVGGSEAWRQTVLQRRPADITGSAATEFAPWGGVIAFDTTRSDGTPRDWSFDIDTEPNPGQDHFYSLALHELAHVLGFGLSDAWERWVDRERHQFVGPAAIAEHGSPVVLDVTVGTPHVHWKNETLSTAYFGGSAQTALMVPVSGGRREFTDLDIAALADIGWEPRPATATPMPGDADENLSFDQLDLVRVLRAGKYLTGAAATWGDGDWNDDGLFDEADIVAAAQTGLYLTGPYAMTPAPALVAIPEPSTLLLVLMATLGGGMLVGATERRKISYEPQTEL